MVAALRLVKFVEKAPIPAPVVELYVDEPGLVPQTTPLEVTGAPPSEVTVPPVVAVVPVMAEAAVVTILGPAGGALYLFCAWNMVRCALEWKADSSIAKVSSFFIVSF